jgi:hypothetical protein
MSLRAKRLYVQDKWGTYFSSIPKQICLMNYCMEVNVKYMVSKDNRKKAE